MFQPLGQRDRYLLYEITSLADLDLATFLPMLDRAWALDYIDQPRLRFDEAYFAKVMRGSSWSAVLARTDHGEPVGFELALERTLYVRGRPLRAYYVSVFTVSADHRRRGLGSWILEGIGRLVFEDRGAEIILSTFHAGHAGSPTVQATIDRIEGWAVSRFHRTPIWSRRLDKDPLLPMTDEPRWVELRLDEAEGPPVLRPVHDPSPGFVLPTMAEIDRGLRSSYDLSFALEASLSDQYLTPGNPASGTLFYDFGDGAWCLSFFNVMHMAINEHRLRPIGQLQMLHASECSHEQICAAIHHLGLRLTRRGCFALTLTDLGMVPHGVLEHLRFKPTDDGIAFAARGPRPSLDELEGVEPPFFLDFT